MGEKGRIDKEKIEKYCQKPADDHLVMVCGMKEFYESLCGPRNETKLKGVLNELGFKEGMVFKF